MDMYEDMSADFFEEVLTDYKEGSSRMQEHLPKVAQGYFDFTEACFADGSVSGKHKQLIALAVSVFAKDEYCIMFHTKMAVEAGVTEDEFMEAIAVSSAIGGGSVFSKGVTLAIDAFDVYSENQPSS